MERRIKLCVMVMLWSKEGSGKSKRGEAEERGEQSMSLAPPRHGSNTARSFAALGLEMVFVVHLPHPLQKIQENSLNLRMNN